MTKANEPETSVRRIQPAERGWEKAGSLLCLMLVWASLGAFLLSQLVVAQGVEQPTPDILVVKQIDAEEVKFKDEGKSDSDLGVVADTLSVPSLKELRPAFGGLAGFHFERLLCLGSRGPPQG